MSLHRTLILALLAIPMTQGDARSQLFQGGDLLATDFGSTRLLRIDPNGTVTPIYTGAPLVGPSGCTMSRDGDLIVADFNTQTLHRFTRLGALTPIATGVPAPIRVAADHDGSFVVTDLTNGNLRRVTASGSQSVIRPGLARPFGVAVDPEGFYLVTEELAGRLLRISRDGTVVTPLATGLGLAHGVAVLPDGDYAVISGNPDFIRRVPRSGGTSTLLISSPPLGNPEAILADDQLGVLVLEDGAPFGNRIVHVDGAGALSLRVGPAAFPPSTNLEAFAFVPTLRVPTDLGTGPLAIASVLVEIPSDAGRLFLIVASSQVYPGQPFGSPDPRQTPLQPDLIFQLTLFGLLSPYTSGWFGVLDSNGLGTGQLDLTTLAPGSLTGVLLHLQAVTGNPAALSGISTISNVGTIRFL